MEKLFCMQVAAQLTVAACNGIGSGLSGGRPIDATLQDPNQRAVNLEVWEIFRAYYSAITQALADNTSWPAPAVATGTVVPDIISSGIAAALPALTGARQRTAWRRRAVGTQVADRAAQIRGAADRGQCPQSRGGACGPRVM